MARYQYLAIYSNENFPEHWQNMVTNLPNSKQTLKNGRDGKKFTKEAKFYGHILLWTRLKRGIPLKQGMRLYKTKKVE